MDKYYNLNYKRFLPTDKSVSILDYGSGTGSFTNWLIKNGYQNVTSYDPGYGLSGIDYLSTQKNKYDLIFSIQVIYFFDNLEKEIKTLVNTLKHDGKIIVEVFNAAMPTSISTRVNCTYMRYGMNEFALKNLMERNNCKTISITGEKVYLNHPYGYAWLFVRFLWFRIVRLLYLIECGKRDSNPTIYSRSIIYQGERVNK